MNSIKNIYQHAGKCDKQKILKYIIAQCVKSRIMNKAIDSILSIDTSEQQRVVIKCMLQSSRLEDNMKTIGIDQ